MFSFRSARLGSFGGGGQSAQPVGSFLRDASTCHLQPGSVRPVAARRRDPGHPDPHRPAPSSHDRPLSASSRLIPVSGEPGPELTESIALRHQSAADHPVAPDDVRPCGPPRPAERDGKRSHDPPSVTPAHSAFRRAAVD